MLKLTERIKGILKNAKKDTLWKKQAEQRQQQRDQQIKNK